MNRLIVVLLLPVLTGNLFAQSDPALDQDSLLYELFEEYENYEEDDGESVFPGILPEDERRRAGFWRKLLERSEQIERESLSRADQVNYDLFRFILEDKIAQVDFESYLMPLNAEGGFHTSFAFSMERMPLNTVEEVERYIRRLNGFGQYAEDQMSLLREGLAKGITQPAIILGGLPAQVAPFIVEAAEESDFYTPLLELPEHLPDTTRERLRREGLRAVEESVLPAYGAFKAFLEEEYIPGARKRIGASALPMGKAYYEQRIRYFTTLDMSPEEVFETGKAEVARIRAEMEAIIRETGFEGSFDDFLDFLRTDPQFYAKTPEALLKEAAWMAKYVDGKLPELFNRLPRLPYTVAPVPDAIAPNYTGGRYVPGSLRRHRAGTYWVNTYKLESRPLYVLPALTLHEAVPGHHLQMALAMELDSVPDFRRRTYLSAYGEGWGLYAEYLGREIGMYRTPYENFGRLTYEMWRACRLVIDVGIHYKEWSREEAVDFLASNSALSLHEVNTEIDRYIGWPGQAVSYKIGELTIRRLRKEAEAELGEDFDKRAFHDLVLSKGSVLLSTLEDMVREWIESQKKEK